MSRALEASGEGGQSGAGCSKQRRLCEQRPRQEMAWCFLEIVGSTGLLALRW